MRIWNGLIADCYSSSIYNCLICKKRFVRFCSTSRELERNTSKRNRITECNQGITQQGPAVRCPQDDRSASWSQALVLFEGNRLWNGTNIGKTIIRRAGRDCGDLRCSYSRS